MKQTNYDREALRITVDYNNMMQETLGERGLTLDELNALPLKAAVEGKKATYALLGKPGFAEKKAELDAAPAKLDKYIIR